MLTMIGRSYFGQDWEVGAELSEEAGVAAFQRHTEAVTAGVPAQRLLIAAMRQAGVRRRGL